MPTESLRLWLVRASPEERFVGGGLVERLGGRFFIVKAVVSSEAGPGCMCAPIDSHHLTVPVIVYPIRPTTNREPAADFARVRTASA